MERMTAQNKENKNALRQRDVALRDFEEVNFFTYFFTLYL